MSRADPIASYFSHRNYAQHTPNPPDRRILSSGLDQAGGQDTHPPDRQLKMRIV